VRLVKNSDEIAGDTVWTSIPSRGRWERGERKGRVAVAPIVSIPSNY